MNFIHSLNLFVSNNSIALLIVLYIVAIVFILAFLSYGKKRDREIPKRYPTNAERISAYKEQRQKEHLERLKKLFDNQPVETIDIRFLDRSGKGKDGSND